MGGGGREHAIVEALHRSGADIYSAMGNSNPGIARRCADTLVVKETHIERVCEYAQDKSVEMAFIGPEAPLEAGLADALESIGIGCVGPSRAAARLETSKSFMRDLLRDNSIPGNLEYRCFDDLDEARSFIHDTELKLVVKPVGLTGGKGVKVEGEHLDGKDGVIEYVREVLDSGIGGGAVVLEEKAVGEEFTLMAFVDGSHLAPMPLVQDHKRAYEGDVGPNTGGMGSYSAENHLLPFVLEEERDAALRTMQLTVDALRKQGMPYRGIMYGQFMLTKDGPRVIEFNARFGDPEAMNVLSILDSDLVKICEAVVDGTLTPGLATFTSQATVCKYVVPAGYGVSSTVGAPIQVDEAAIAKTGAKIYYSSVNTDGDMVTTTSSRSLGVVGVADTIDEAEKQCEAALGYVRSDAITVRHDIGKSELVQRRIDHMHQVRGE